MAVFGVSGLPNMFYDPAIGSCLLIVVTAMQWTEARDYCQNMNMELAVIETAAESSFAANVIIHVTGNLIYVTGYVTHVTGNLTYVTGCQSQMSNKTATVFMMILFMVSQAILSTLQAIFTSQAILSVS